jgi:hypothetical protein
MHSVFMRCIFRPQRGHLQATHFFKESTALCTLSIVLLKYVVIINFVVIGCLFFLSFVLRPLCAPLGVPLSWLCVSCVDLCSSIPWLCVSCVNLCSLLPWLCVSCVDLCSSLPWLCVSCVNLCSLLPWLCVSCVNLCSLLPWLCVSCVPCIEYTQTHLIMPLKMTTN